MTFSKIEIKTFKLEDLIDKTLEIKSYTDNSNTNIELIVAVDVKTGDIFVLKENRHPVPAK